MMYSVTDVSGLNRISERVLAGHALAGMLAYSRSDRPSETKPAIGLTMFGVTTPCVQAVTKALGERCVPGRFPPHWHRRSMEKLVDSGLLAGVMPTTEIADELVGGVLSAGPERLDAIIRARVPYVGSWGARHGQFLGDGDGATTAFGTHQAPRAQSKRDADADHAECAKIGRFLVDKLNRMEGPVRFLIPEGGVSAIDAAGHRTMRSMYTPMACWSDTRALSFPASYAATPSSYAEFTAFCRNNKVSTWSGSASPRSL